MRRLLTASILFTALALPSAAGAVVTGSTITSPTSGVINDTGAGQLSVRGTTVGTGNVDLVCYFNATETRNVSTNVAVFANRFSTSVHKDRLPSGACTLRAVPTGTTPADPSPFAGPQLTTNYLETFSIDGGPNGGTQTDYFVSQQQRAGYADYDSVAGCGLCDMRLFTDPANFINSAFLFYGNAALYDAEGTTRAYARIDGHNALLSSAAGSAAPSSSNFPALSTSISVDPASGDLQIVEDQDAVRCPTDVLPYGTAAGQNACSPNLIATGVHLHRVINQTSAGVVVRIVDTWNSTDSQPHALDLDYDQFFQHSASSPPLYEPSFNFTWTGAGYQLHNNGDSIAPAPSGPATILIRGNSAAADGNTTYPQGAITANPAPSGARFYNTSPSEHNDFALNFQRTVPAGGSLAIKQTFSIGSTQAAVQALAAQAEDQQEPPVVSLSGPGTTASPTATLTGTASDSRRLAGVTVNGTPVGVGAGGSFSTLQTLRPGANTFTAVATDGAGNQTSAQATVTYTPPPSPAGPSGTPSKFTIAGVSVNHRGVISIRLTSQQRGSFTAIARTGTKSLRPTKRGRKTNVYGTGSFSSASPGQVTLRIKPGRAAKRAIKAQHRRLKLKVQVTFAASGASSRAVATRSIRTKRYRAR